MLGFNPGWAVSQGEILAELFAIEGYEVLLSSKKPRRVPRLLDTLSSLLRWRSRFDIAVVSVFSGLGFYMAEATTALLAALRKPMVLHLHGGNMPSFAANHPLRIRTLLARADAVVAPSEYLSTALHPFADGIRVIPNVIQIDAYRFKQRSSLHPRLLWMRTFHSIYNPKMAIEAIRSIRQECDDVRVTMAGQDKGALEETQRLAARYGLTEHVRFAGLLNGESKRLAFDEHDIFLNTTHVDNVPVSLIEACASGLPLVATRVGGIPYLWRDEESALLVPDADAGAMAAAIKRLLGDPSLAANLSRAGRQLAERFSWEVVRVKWEQLFDSVIANRR